MQVLLVNLKQFYQRRSLWLAYIYFGCLLFGEFYRDSSQESVAWIWFLAMLSGGVVSGTSRNTMNKPFARVLPGHLLTVRTMLFLIGLAVSILGAVAFVSRTGTAIPEAPAIFLAAVCVSMVMYLTGAEWMLTPLQIRGLFEFIPLFFLFATLVVLFTHLYLKFGPMIIRYPLWMISAGILTCLVVWLQMGRREWSRGLFGDDRSLSRPVERSEVYKAMERWYTRGAGASAVTASFFLARMKGCADYSTARYIWGTLYATLGALAAWWRWLIRAFIAVILISGYVADELLPFVFLWIAYALGHSSWMPLHSPMLLPAGRRERFLAIISLAGVTTGILLLSIAVIAAVSIPLSWLIPEFEVWNTPVVYHRVSLINVWAPLVFVPLLGIPHVFLPRRWWSKIDVVFPMAAPLLFMAAVIATTSISLILDDFVLVRAMSTRPATCVTTLIILMWVFFVIECHYKTRTRSLVGQ